MIIIKILKLFFYHVKLFYYSIYNNITLKYTNVNYGRNIKIHGKIYITNNGTITIGNNFKANSSRNSNQIGGDTVTQIVVKKGAKLHIGDNFGISNSTIVCWQNIEIGNYVYIGGGCKIWDSDFHSIDPIERRHKGDKLIKKAPILISDYAFIGGSSIILKGVTVGKNAVVAAGSVVTKDIPDNEIWGGNPAKFLKKVTINSHED